MIVHLFHHLHRTLLIIASSLPLCTCSVAGLHRTDITIHQKFGLDGVKHGWRPFPRYPNLPSRMNPIVGATQRFKRARVPGRMEPPRQNKSCRFKRGSLKGKFTMLPFALPSWWSSWDLHWIGNPHGRDHVRFEAVVFRLQGWRQKAPNDSMSLVHVEGTASKLPASWLSRHYSLRLY